MICLEVLLIIYNDKKIVPPKFSDGTISEFRLDAFVYFSIVKAFLASSAVSDFGSS